VDAVPQASRASLRDTTARGPFASGGALEVRALVSQVTTKDGLGLALRFHREVPPAQGDPWGQQHADWNRIAPTLRVEVKVPGGATHTLELADTPVGPPQSRPVSMLVQTFIVDGAAIAQGPERRPWKTPVPGLLATPGTHVVTVSATIELDGKPVALRSGPLTFTVLPPTDPRRPLVDIERAASEVARTTWGATGIPAPSDPTVDDVEGNLVVRFRRSGAGAGETGYEDDILEVWLDPTGKTLAVDAYRHFNCIAEGTWVATPHGPTPVEALAVGSQVDAFDVVTQTRTVAVVLRTDASYAEVVRRLGALRATPEHPVWAGGAWVPLGEVPAGATLLGVDLAPLAAAEPVLDTPATVYDLTVSPPNTYFAGGVLVHNKAVHVPLGGNGPWGPLFHRSAARP